MTFFNKIQIAPVASICTSVVKSLDLNLKNGRGAHLYFKNNFREIGVLKKVSKLLSLTKQFPIE